MARDRYCESRARCTGCKNTRAVQYPKNCKPKAGHKEDMYCVFCGTTTEHVVIRDGEDGS